ncbi:MAG: hypothetical protein HC795_09550 [Coleofasciculaceae cyanobacterium RL_1_1]|nr:hypothetical protein [Coleofasciculaceae cyanobacterium RL_1_1]
MSFLLRPRFRPQLSRPRERLQSWIRLATLSAIVSLAAPSLAQTWAPAYDGRSEPDGLLYGISGMAVLDDASDYLSNRIDLLVVHDNKSDDSGRFSLVSWRDGTIALEPVTWASDLPLPIDLEGLSSIPGDDRFIALESDGEFYRVAFDRAAMAVTVSDRGVVPPLPEGSNLESIALTRLADQTLIVWAHRGQDDDPAILYWGTIELETLAITPIGSQPITVPAPVGNVRHISDLTVTATGQVFISSTTDNGNDGPFESIAYEIGLFGFDDDNRPTFTPYPNFIGLGQGDGYKVEAIVRDPLRANPAVLLGTDDENFGSAIGR